MSTALLYFEICLPYIRVEDRDPKIQKHIVHKVLPLCLGDTRTPQSPGHTPDPGHGTRDTLKQDIQTLCEMINLKRFQCFISFHNLAVLDIVKEILSVMCVRFNCMDQMKNCTIKKLQD